MGSIISFYASVIALIALLFEVINYAFPKITNAYQYYFPTISFQVATLIVAFPLFLFLSWLLQKSYTAEPTLREVPLRRWLAYITLFVAGAVAAGDLITVIYMFLDGQELTKGFLLKILTLLVVMGGVFLYFWREIRNKIDPRERNIWRVVSTLVVLGSIILGFAVVGTPAAQRAYRYDSQKVGDLQNLQWQIVTHWQQKGSLPASLEDLSDSLKPGFVPVDPQSGESYGYERTGNLTFELCAVFNRESRERRRPYDGGAVSMPMRDMYYGPEMENWQHSPGEHCFERTIDPDYYPVNERIRP